VQYTCSTNIILYHLIAFEIVNNNFEGLVIKDEGVAEEEEDNGCRPIIGLDGCHLKGVYGGQLLSAVGRDGNDNLFPIAMAVVEAETKDSWTWFLMELTEGIKAQEKMKSSWISDRHKVWQCCVTCK
jgi:hypothetical protein